MMNQPIKKNKILSFDSDNRINFVLAIIFLLFLGVLGKLFMVQIVRHDLYIASANNQHETMSDIIPERGKIFVQNPNDPNDPLYPIATNKDFVLIYTSPKDVENSERIIAKLYNFFKKEYVEEEVDELLKIQESDRLIKQLNLVANWPEDEKKKAEQRIRREHELFIKDLTYLEIKAEKREEMIEERRKAIEKEYQKVFDKDNDPYEELEKKVEKELAKQFHLSLISDDWEKSTIKPEDLVVKNNDIYIKETNEIMKYSGMGYMTETYRYYPDNEIGANILGFVSTKEIDMHGYYGLEGYFDNELFGQYGKVIGERGAGGLMIVNDREYSDRVDGDDLILTIDHSVQNMVCSRLKKAVEHYGAESGSIIVMNPKTGAIISMCSEPNFDPNNYKEVDEMNNFNNPAVFDQYESGSVIKAITMAAALDQGGVTASTTYNDEGQIKIDGWDKYISNSDFDKEGAYGITNMVTVLEKSLNTGAIFAMRSIGGEKFTEYMKNFGFGDTTGIELGGEGAGNISSIVAKKGRKTPEIFLATASYGQGITTTPIQLVTAFSVIANGGELVKPYIVKEIVHSNGEKTVTRPVVLRRVISEQTSTVLSGMLSKVVEDGHAGTVKVPGYYIAGKTGTAQIASGTEKGYLKNLYNHTFIAFAPSTNAKFVVLVKISKPKGYEYSTSTTVPVAHDVIEFLLNYYQIPKERRTN